MVEAIPPTPAVAAPNSGQQKPMLAWWACIPLVALVVVQSIFGWPDAKAQALGPDFVGAYFIATLVGGVFFSLGIAWIIYRLIDRSQLAGTVTFSVMMALCCQSVFWQAESLRARESVLLTFPAAGIAVNSPPGWRTVAPDRPSTITRWISPDSNADHLEGLIMVELKGPVSGDTKAIAGRLADRWGGHVIDTPQTLDGETAWRIRADRPASDLQSVDGVVAVHGGKLYLIEGGVTCGNLCQAQVDFIRDNWKWIASQTK